MTDTEFNTKYADYLDKGFYGLAIPYSNVVEYLDKEFTKEIAINPDFKYQQIKTKFDFVCVYADTLEPQTLTKWHYDIAELIKQK